jgi:hypothetical protein
MREIQVHSHYIQLFKYGFKRIPIGRSLLLFKWVTYTINETIR